MTAIALIVHAPEQTEQLDLCLAGLYSQRFEDFEILVTDMAPDNRHDDVVAHHREHLHQPLRHIRAPGEPLNLGRALNAAVLSTEAEYLVFLGGNCIVQPGFLDGHFAVADYGYFAHGETLPLDRKLSNALNAATLGTGQAFDENWLRAVSPEWYAKHLRGSAINVMRDWLKKDTPSQQYWNCDSSSCFRADLLGVDGFDMDVDDWRQNRDIANRLQNNGLEPLATGVHGNVLRFLCADDRPVTLERGGRVPASLEPGGEIMAVAGLSELMQGSRAA